MVLNSIGLRVEVMSESGPRRPFSDRRRSGVAETGGRLPAICRLSVPSDVRPPSSASYRGGRAGAQLTAQSERIRSWLVANRFQAVSQASMMSARLVNTELASQWLRR